MPTRHMLVSMSGVRRLRTTVRPLCRTGGEPWTRWSLKMGLQQARLGLRRRAEVPLPDRLSVGSTQGERAPRAVSNSLCSLSKVANLSTQFRKTQDASTSPEVPPQSVRAQAGPGGWPVDTRGRWAQQVNARRISKNSGHTRRAEPPAQLLIVPQPRSLAGQPWKAPEAVRMPA